VVGRRKGPWRVIQLSALASKSFAGIEWTIHEIAGGSSSEPSARAGLPSIADGVPQRCSSARNQLKPSIFLRWFRDT
jgi:hypothetical protein